MRKNSNDLTLDFTLKRKYHNHFLQNRHHLLTSAGNLSYFITALLKSAEPRNSNDISVADKYTPLNACFFMRSTNTPQERPELHESPERLSMVACYGKGFALCCVPLIAVFEPVTRYRPKASKLQAVTSKYLFSGVTAMIYKFLLLGKKRLKIAILANSEQEARQFLNLPRDKAAFIARIKGVKYA
ncbi:ash family protein [Avibacterium paragallinarum]|uniref:ash family protein n=1 Tax=Avibacterium paragallinarum TaxID=728 RepID=UPI00021ACF46|nr:ash family protein [Avibacterium paragallinarum]AZI13299.1 hypothetical protein EIA51_00750 [Avibacterium paragallinarum]QIR12763.1 ash family protein [Avibacterium paragallinarum]QJE10717.1 ash family protein [Avibacterium paragallinarum]QJE12910.1 ash family protein [Avibacterium paragallinarum]QJE15113.1 ash family protein [Avibacterium paragallinarum]